MNARSFDVELKLREEEVVEVTSGLLHTILFLRSSAAGESGSTVFTRGTPPVTKFSYVDCRTIDFTHVQVESPDLKNRIHREATLFFTQLKRGQRGRGSITLEFYERSEGLLSTSCETWEMWRIGVTLTTCGSLFEKRRHSQKACAEIADFVSLITTAVNFDTHLPLAYTPEHVGRIYDTSLRGVQPYLFKITHRIDCFRHYNPSVLTDLCKWIGKGAFLD
ncbi:autophagy-related protein 101-like [Galendromus occidentalis]|uniref:Autophagy-related protein 101 n=1 Tax=Galendromus occidentalis TaxID=34638 RepID=A0AAJ6QRG4_9ACAR|nr:autophagy-related protein 101-like [Galendromus occidentalis]